MSGIIVFLPITCHYFLDFFDRCHMMGKSEELTSLLSVQSLAYLTFYSFVFVDHLIKSNSLV